LFTFSMSLGTTDYSWGLLRKEPWAPCCYYESVSSEVYN
jgi:hypothetical protein